MHPVATSPRLPGVPVLRLDTTGSEFSRWRRSIKFALETKGTWAYCNGACPMPMPAPNSSTSTTSNKNSNDVQPGLLEERRAWVRQDREVKLDIFFSLAEEVMDEVFEVGPPLPPSNCNAQEMMKALDEHFEAFSFGAYHHAFCRFLNLHIDQYATIEDFNKEFSTMLEDLLDHGHPLSNTQACSAYFSKLRCTHNPWVAKKLRELDAQSLEPEVYDLMQESPPWSCIKPLATKSSQIFHLYHREPTLEEYEEGSSAHSTSNASPQLSNASIMSSKFSHSKQTSIDSQEIIVQPNPGIIGFDPQALCVALEALPNGLLPKLYIPTDTESATPDWLNAKTSVAPMLLSAPPTRPLPALPPQTLQTPTIEPRARSASPHLPVKTRSLPNFSRPRTADPSSIPSSHLQVEPASLTSRPRTPTFPSPPLSDHPAFRTSSLDPRLPNDSHRPPPPVKSPWRAIQPSQHEDTTPDDASSIYSCSNNSSTLNLPLHGTQKDNGAYEHPRSPPPLPTLSPKAHTIALPNSPCLPPLAPLPPLSLTPTTPDNVLPSLPPPPPPPPPPSTIPQTSPTSTIQTTQSHRLSGDSLLESSSETRERAQATLKRRRAKGWSIGVNIARFTHSKGVKEMI